MYYDRDDVALKGFKKYFKMLSEGEREQAERLMKYQNKRGGRVVLQPIQVLVIAPFYEYTVQSEILRIIFTTKRLRKQQTLPHAVNGIGPISGIGPGYKFLESTVQRHGKP